MWEKYFARVRWLELFMSMATSFMGALLVNLQAGEKIGQDQLLKAAGVAFSVGWAYLRMPKSEMPTEAEGSATLNLPPKLDPSEAIVQKLVALGYPEALARSEVARDLQGMAQTVGVQL